MENRILKNTPHIAAGTLICCLLFAVCSCAPKMDKPELPKEDPQRIVSLSPAITEILFAIGAGDRVVGVTQYCDYPAAALTRAKVGGFSGATVSMEQIRVLNPDLVILSEEMHGRIISLLNDLDIPSLAVEPRNMSQVFNTIALMGEISGCADGAEKVIAEMTDKIAMVKENVHDRGRPGVFWILNEDPLMTAGSDTFVSEAIDLGGGKNIFGEIPGQWPVVSIEQVLLRKPDWVFFGNDVDPALLLKDRWQIIPAVREGRAIMVNADILYRYGPRLADAVDSIAKILHPDADKLP